MREPPGHIFLRFLRFGLLAWGGPAAQIAMIRRECVEELGWIGDEEFARTLAVYQVLPGPEAHELCVHLGVLRGGRLGGFLAGLGFMLPGFVLMVALSAIYVEVGHRPGPVLRAPGGGGRAGGDGGGPARAARSSPICRLSSSRVAAFAATPARGRAVPGRAGAGGLVYWACGGCRAEGRRAVGVARGRRARAGGVRCRSGVTLFLEGLKTGLLTFGGAYSAVPVLQQSAVERPRVAHAGPVRRRARDQRHPAGAADHLRHVRRLPGRRARRRRADHASACSCPAFVFPLFLHRQLVAASPGRAAAPVPARRDGRRRRADRRGHGRPARRERPRRAERAARARRVRGALPRAGEADGALGRCSAAARSGRCSSSRCCDGCGPPAGRGSA